MNAATVLDGAPGIKVHVRAARRLLGGPPSAVSVRMVMAHLRRIEDLLDGSWSALDSHGEAARLLRLRDELASHLLAASQCADAEVQLPAIVAVLRRAVALVDTHQAGRAG